jgi:hypothetical protein
MISLGLNLTLLQQKKQENTGDLGIISPGSTIKKEKAIKNM